MGVLSLLLIKFDFKMVYLSNQKSLFALAW